MAPTRTAVVPPIQTAGLVGSASSGSPRGMAHPDLYSIQEDALADSPDDSSPSPKDAAPPWPRDRKPPSRRGSDSPRTASSQPSTVLPSHHHHPQQQQQQQQQNQQHPGPLPSPTMANNRVPGTPPPNALNSPRKLSGSSTATTASTMFSRESARSELQRSSSASSWSASSWTSNTTAATLESWESGQWKPLDLEQARRSPGTIALRRKASFVPREPEPGEVFATLPDEVLDLMLDTLKRLHLADTGEGCATCWMRDLCSISLASRRWSTLARKFLYQDIQLVGADSAAHKKRLKVTHGARMLLLRRTLRSDPAIASLVRSLKVPRPDPREKGVNAKAMERYEDLTASLVMACPNLETLDAAPAVYNHSFRRIFHALSTRGKLREMHWLLGPAAGQQQQQQQQQQQPPPPPTPTPQQQKQRATQPTSPSLSSSPSFRELDTSQVGAFLDLHRNWSSLTTLSVYGLPGSGLASDSLLTRTLSMLSSLEHLYLCNLGAGSFDDDTLLSLPPLRTLSLTNVDGITSAGLSSMATRPQARSLRALHLRHTPLTSLAALARILSNLTLLTSFSLGQTFPPLMPEDDPSSFTLWMMPYLASPSLRSLHWDITSHRDCANVADDILARSIAAGGFPSLRFLRAPNDPDALFQNLCRPLERIDLSTDRFCVSDMSTSSQPPDSPSPHSPGFFFSLASPRSAQSPFPDVPPPPPCTDLRLARLGAQTRLEKARAHPSFAIVVTDENGVTVDQLTVGGYLGNIASAITYHLLPDAGSADRRGGAVDVRDLGSHAGESLVDGGVGCTGEWNCPDRTQLVSRPDRERWWHTERGRWSRVELR